jgi:hypothetical protein
MNNKKLFWGTLLVSIGLIILINNLQGLYFQWDDILKMWPVVFILGGLALMIRQPFIKSFLVACMAFILALSIFASIKSAGGFISYVINDTDFTVGEVYAYEYSEAYNPGTQKAVLNFDGGAGSFKIRDTTSSIFHAFTEANENNYRLNSFGDSSYQTIDFEMTGKKIRFFNGNLKNKVEMSLNPEPEWDINFDVGAASMNLDLSAFKISNLSVDMGAASLKLKFGSLSVNTGCTINAGVSSIDISVPVTVGCEIKIDGGLSSKDFSGFEKINSGLYRTSNYNESENKIYIDIDAGVSSISIERY